MLPFVDAVVEARLSLPAEFRSRARLVFTAHSIPEAMTAGCDYERQLHETARLVASGAGFDAWTMAWQSRSGPPSVPWLEPDVNQCLEELARGHGVEAVVLAPVGFVTDHMEVRWDLDVVAAGTAGALGLRLARAVTPGTGPDDRFVAMWQELIEERLDPDMARRSLGRLGVGADVCPAGCCPSRS